MILALVMPHPRSKIPKFTVVPVVRHPHFRANQDDLAIMNYDTAVIDNIFVHYRPIHCV